MSSRFSQIVKKQRNWFINSFAMSGQFMVIALPFSKTLTSGMTVRGNIGAGWRFAESLGELCSRFNDADAKRSLVEVIWWRDNAHRIPWIPPRGDGSRYNRMMQFIDPSAPSADEEIRRVRRENTKERTAPYRPSIDPQLASLFTASIPLENEKSLPTLVDWSFLDKDDGQPGEPAEWVKK